MTTWEAGAEAEAIALESERLSVSAALRHRVRLVSDSPRFGYDIESLDVSGEFPTFKAIEVKTWNREGFFYVSRNEINMLSALGKASWIYLVDLSTRKVIRKINDPFAAGKLDLEPINYRCYF